MPSIKPAAAKTGDTVRVTLLDNLQHTVNGTVVQFLLAITTTRGPKGFPSMKRKPKLSVKSSAYILRKKKARLPLLPN